MRARYQYRHISSRRMLGGREVKPAHTSRRNGRTLKVRWYKHMPISPGGNSAWRHAVVLPVAVSVIFTVYWRCLPASRPGELHSPSGAREYRLLQRIFGRRRTRPLPENKGDSPRKKGRAGGIRRRLQLRQRSGRDLKVFVLECGDFEFLVTFAFVNHPKNAFLHDSILRLFAYI